MNSNELSRLSDESLRDLVRLLGEELTRRIADRKKQRAEAQRQVDDANRLIQQSLDDQQRMNNMLTMFNTFF